GAAPAGKGGVAMSKAPATEDIAALRERFGEAIPHLKDHLGEVTLYVRPDSIVEVCRFLRDDPAFQFNMLADLCGLDLGMGMEPRFEVNYHLNSLTKRHRLRLKAQLEGEEP